MATLVDSRPSPPSLKDSALVAELQKLRKTDNWHNLIYLARTWLFLGLTIGGTVAFYQWQEASGISVWWNVPVTLLAILLVGAGQHQLTGLAHEASHHTLLKHRLANDLVSDWFCMFPMFSSTHHYRLQHMAHHQFVNDPDRDPDVSQLKTSGHWLDFPLSKSEFIRTLVKQLWVPNLIKYMRVRARYNSIGTDKNPYIKKGAKQHKTPILVGALYMLTQVIVLTTLVYLNQPVLLAVIPALLYGAVMAFYALIPSNWYHQSRVHPVIPGRYMTLMRITFMTALFGSLAWASYLTGRMTGLYFALLWVTPIFTSFSFFMVLRQIVQHGNGDRGWLTNTRTFFVNPLIQFAVFPFGQDYHLPHHMFATVPHYRLRQLHEFLLNYPEYKEQGVVVEGYFWPKHVPPTHPTVLDVVGPEYHYGTKHAIFIDDSVLEQDVVDGMTARTAKESADNEPVTLITEPKNQDKRAAS
jgi:fatty acid desaturase